MDWKKIGNGALYLIPGYGIYDQYKKPQEKRSKIGSIGAIAYLGLVITKNILLPSYLVTGSNTGEWNPVEQLKMFFDSSEEDQGKLEKTIMYEDSLKNQTNSHQN